MCRRRGGSRVARFRPVFLACQCHNGRARGAPSSVIAPAATIDIQQSSRPGCFWSTVPKLAPSGWTHKTSYVDLSKGPLLSSRGFELPAGRQRGPVTAITRSPWGYGRDAGALGTCSSITSSTSTCWFLAARAQSNLAESSRVPSCLADVPRGALVPVKQHHVQKIYQSAHKAPRSGRRRRRP